jgi:hypothetical protein
MSDNTRAVMRKVRAGFYTLEKAGQILILQKEHDLDGYVYWAVTQRNCSGGQVCKTLRAAEVVGRRFLGEYT